MFAATHPERTSSVVTIAGHPATYRSEDYPWGTTSEQIEGLIAMIERTWGSEVEIARRQVRSARGRLIKSTGDGILATFDGPARAIGCAKSLRDELRRVGIDIRAGLHTGEIELRGDDIGGIAVHIGARVSSLAGSGEVLVSRTVADLVTGSGIVFDDRGSHELRGVPGAWQLLAVAG